MSLCAFLEGGVFVEEIRTAHHSTQFFFGGGAAGFGLVYESS
jgi:hypothetical protein